MNKLKIRILKDIDFHFEPSRPVYQFKQNEIIDIEDHKAKELIQNGVAVEVEILECVNVDNVEIIGNIEEKNLDISTEENKDFGQVIAETESTKKRQGRKPKIIQ